MKNSDWASHSATADADDDSMTVMWQVILLRLW